MLSAERSRTGRCQKKGGLTFAPEAGTQRLRDVINKNVTEDDLFAAIDAAFAAGCPFDIIQAAGSSVDDIASDAVGRG